MSRNRKAASRAVIFIFFLFLRVFEQPENILNYRINTSGHAGLLFFWGATIKLRDWLPIDANYMAKVGDKNLSTVHARVSLKLKNVMLTVRPQDRMNLSSHCFQYPISHARISERGGNIYRDIQYRILGFHQSEYLRFTTSKLPLKLLRSLPQV